MQLFLQLLSPYFLSFIFYIISFLLCLIYTLIVIYTFYLVLIIIMSYIIYKAIYNYSFLDKELLHSQCINTDNEGAICSFSVSLASLWRPLQPLVIFIIYLAYVFLLEPLDLSDFKAWYKAFSLFHYFLYSRCIVYLITLFYPKASGDCQDLNQVVFIKYFYANIFFQPVLCPYSLFFCLLVLQGNFNVSTLKVANCHNIIYLFVYFCKDFCL